MFDGSESVFERRKHPRYYGKLPVEYQRATSTKIRTGHTVNIGDGGLMVSLSERLQIGEQMEMKFYCSSGLDLVAVRAVVKVIWAENEENKDGYCRFGVSYVSISPEDRASLKSFLALHADSATAAELIPPFDGLLKRYKPLL